MKFKIAKAGWALPTFIPPIALLILVSVAACEQQAASGLATTQMQIGGKTYTLEIAVTEKEKETGLMHRDNLPEDHGMIFPWETEEVRTFWNHDVHFPLDLLFLGANGGVVSIKQMEAYSDANVSSDVPAQYVIELNKGTADQLQIRKGTQLVLPKDVLPAEPATKP